MSVVVDRMGSHLTTGPCVGREILGFYRQELDILKENLTVYVVNAIARLINESGEEGSSYRLKVTIDGFGGMGQETHRLTEIYAQTEETKLSLLLVTSAQSASLSCFPTECLIQLLDVMTNEQGRITLTKARVLR
jgi:hypothetical protein